MLADVVREDLVVVVVVLLLGESSAPVELGDYTGDEVPVQIHLCVEVSWDLRELEEVLVLTAEDFFRVRTERLSPDSVVYARDELRRFMRREPVDSRSAVLVVDLLLRLLRLFGHLHGDLVEDAVEPFAFRFSVNLRHS